MLVQIHTFPVDHTLILLLPLPSAMIILFERFEARPVTLAPIIVFAEPVMISRAVFAPKTVLLFPVVLLVNVIEPITVF